MDANIAQRSLPSPSPQRQVLAFAAHYVEMVVAMFVGMAVVGFVDAALLRWIALDRIRTEPLVDLAFMVGEMSAAMIAWMVVRGHGRREIGRMAGAMVIPGAVSAGLAFIGVMSPLTAEIAYHPVMLLAMLGVMVIDRRAYTGHGAHQATQRHERAQGHGDARVVASQTT